MLLNWWHSALALPIQEKLIPIQPLRDEQLLHLSIENKVNKYPKYFFLVEKKFFEAKYCWITIANIPRSIFAFTTKLVVHFTYSSNYHSIKHAFIIYNVSTYSF